MSRSLQFDIVANDKASAKMKEVQGAAGQFAKSIGSMFAGIVSAQALLGRALNFARESFRFGADLKDSAAAVGLTVTEFQQLEYAAKMAGVPVEKMQKAFKDLRVVMRDAQQGNERAVLILKTLGFTQEQIASGTISASDAFLKVSEAISSAKTEQEKFNIASLLFSERYAQDLIPVLTNFNELKKLINETPLISDEDAKRLDEFDDFMTKMETRAKVFAAKTIEAATLSESEDIKLGNDIRAAFGVAPVVPKADAGPSPGSKEIAGKLAAIGSKTSVGSAGAAAIANVTTMAAIGGAAGFRAGAKTPELSTLEKIEQNTRPEAEIPANGSTDFSKGGGPDSSYNALVARVRATPRRRDSAPR